MHLIAITTMEMKTAQSSHVRCINAPMRLTIPPGATVDHAEQGVTQRMHLTEVEPEPLLAYKPLRLSLRKLLFSERAVVIPDHRALVPPI
ncbi:hypothetical protein [Streptomyces sp. NPDC001930]|uniref:hypothetical protein n=1 Tax=Streptomyces sp. NPDC001930 TaxID=3364625 RepID=UPI00367EB803